MFRTINDDILSGSSLVASVDGESVDLTNIYGYSVQITWTSTTAVASVKLQESNDGSNWVDVSGASQAISNDSGSVILERSDVFVKHLRVVFTYTSGTVTSLSSVLNAKGI